MMLLDLGATVGINNDIARMVKRLEGMDCVWQ